MRDRLERLQRHRVSLRLDNGQVETGVVSAVNDHGVVLTKLITGSRRVELERVQDVRTEGSVEPSYLGLCDMVWALVPLRVLELGPTPPDQLRRHLDTMTCDVRTTRTPNGGPCCTGAATILATHADALQFKPGTPESGAARRALVDGLAVMTLHHQQFLDWAAGAWPVTDTIRADRLLQRAVSRNNTHITRMAEDGSDDG